MSDHTAENDARRFVYALNTDECHGIITRNGEQGPCGKPTVCVIDDPEAGPWSACVWHAHRYGAGRMVTLAQLRVIPPAVGNDPHSLGCRLWMNAAAGQRSCVCPVSKDPS